MKRIICCVFSVDQQLYNWLSKSHHISHSETVKENELRGAIQTVTLNDAVWLLSIGCDNSKQAWTSKRRPWEAFTGPGRQVESTGGRHGILNTRVSASWWLLTDWVISANLQSQIQMDLRHFISIWWCWDSYGHCRKNFWNIWKPPDCF